MDKGRKVIGLAGSENSKKKGYAFMWDLESNKVSRIIDLSYSHWVCKKKDQTEFTVYTNNQYHSFDSYGKRIRPPVNSKLPAYIGDQLSALYRRRRLSSICI